MSRIHLAAVAQRCQDFAALDARYERPAGRHWRLTVEHHGAAAASARDAADLLARVRQLQADLAASERKAARLFAELQHERSLRIVEEGGINVRR